MENEFPIAEKVIFEESASENNADSRPVASPEEISIIDTQEIVCLPPREFTSSLFSDEKNQEIEKMILSKHNPPNYLPIKSVLLGNYHFKEVLHVYRELEFRKLINYKPKVISPPKKEYFPWTKKETLKLLEGIDSFGDDWNAIEIFVKRSKGECILQFLKMDMKVGRLIHPNKRMADVVFLSSMVHPSVGSAAAREALDLKKKPNYQVMINKAKEQLLLEDMKLTRLRKVLLESMSLKLKEKINDFKNVLVAIEKEKNEIKEEVADQDKNIKELSDIIKEMKNHYL